jgi:hypothetical protein
MKDLESLKTIAVLIDAENAQHSKLGVIMDELLKHGHVTAKNAYGDWTNERLKNWPEVLNRLAISPHQHFVRTAGKNSADIALVIDAMDMFHAEDFDAFAIVSSDSDFTGLASRLRRGGKYVFGFGEEKTPESFRKACDDFILTELLGSTAPAPSGHAIALSGGLLPEEEDIISLLRAAASEHSEDDGWTLTTHAGNVIKRQRPDFSPKQFGCKSLGQVIGKFDRYFEIRRVARGDGTADQFREGAPLTSS